jgi:uncharacterized protein YijF (DUF1287 family)
MIKFYKNKNIKLKTKIGLTISILAFFIAIANVFINNEIVRIIIWAMCTCVFMLALYSSYEDIQRLQKENILKAYEIDCLRWSYRGMGRYIDHMNLPELEDIDTRISNELNDIEIKKEDYAKRLGIKP